MHLSKKAGNTSVKNRLVTGIKLLLQDLWNIRIAILVFAIYFVIGRKLLYSLCPMVIMTGFPCPGCGLTRAMFMVLRGDFAGAWKMHPFIYGVIILVGWFCVRRYIQRKETKSLGKWVILLCVGLILYYVYRMVRYFPGDAPMSYYYGSVGYRVWEIVKGGK